MLRDILETIVLFLGLCWFVYKFFSHKNIRHLCIAILIGVFLPSRWPLFLPMKISLACMAFVAAGFLIYEQYFQRHFKHSSPLANIYILLFVVFGILLLGEVIISYSRYTMRT